VWQTVQKGAGRGRSDETNRVFLSWFVENSLFSLGLGSLLMTLTRTLPVTVCARAFSPHTPGLFNVSPTMPIVCTGWPSGTASRGNQVGLGWRRRLPPRQGSCRGRMWLIGEKFHISTLITLHAAIHCETRSPLLLLALLVLPGRSSAPASPLMRMRTISGCLLHDPRRRCNQRRIPKC
jgi:hypothetical protein